MKASLLTLFIFLSCCCLAQTIPSDYQGAADYLGKKGDFKDGVFKIGLPRNHLRVAVKGIALPTAFGFTGWRSKGPAFARSGSRSHSPSHGRF